MENNNYVSLDMEATGKRVSHLISDSGMSDKEIGRLMNLSVQCINKWRNGKGIPDVENLFILKQILGIRMDDFFVPAQSARDNYRVDVDRRRNDAVIQGRLAEYYMRIQQVIVKGELNERGGRYS